MSDPTKNLWKTIAMGAISMLVGIGFGGIAWGSQRATIDEYGRKIERLEKNADTDHDILIEIRAHVANMSKNAESNAALLAEIKMLRDEIARTRSPR